MKYKILFVVVFSFFISTFACKQGELPAGKQERPITGINMPTDMAFAKNGTLYFTEKPGSLRVVKDGKLQQQPLLNVDVPPVFGYDETGLLGLALSPDFEKDNFIYLYHSYEKDGELFNRVIRINAANPGSGEKIILDKIAGSRIHNGGKLKFGPDKYLYISTGETGIPELSKKIPGLNGKILRVTLDGKPPEVFAFGLRNVFGIAFDDKGRLFATENGPGGDDEINLIKPGADYGWPDITGDPNGNDSEVPLITYKEAIAPTGIIFYTGDLIPKVKGHLLFGDYNNGYLYKLTLKDGKASSDIVHSAGSPILAIAQSPDGAIYIATENQIKRITNLNMSR